jgi:hypothetical protein
MERLPVKGIFPPEQRFGKKVAFRQRFETKNSAPLKVLG